MRVLGGVLVGIVVAMATIWLVEAVNATVFSLQPPDLNDPDSVNATIAAMPLAPKLIVVAGWFAGATLGAAAAVLVARIGWAGWIPALAVLGGGILNALVLKHPLWMELAALVAPVAGGYAGVALGRRRLARSRP